MALGTPMNRKKYGACFPSPSPGGRIENSPAVHCRVQMRFITSPEGTADSSAGRFDAEILFMVGGIQPSLRDSISVLDHPTLKGWAIFRSPSGRELPDPLPRSEREGGSSLGAMLGCARRVFRRYSLLDNHVPLRYTMLVNDRAAELRRTKMLGHFAGISRRNILGFVFAVAGVALLTSDVRWVTHARTK